MALVNSFLITVAGRFTTQSNVTVQCRKTHPIKTVTNSEYMMYNITVLLRPASGLLCRVGHCQLLGSEVSREWTGDLRPSESSCGEEVYLAARAGLETIRPKKIITFMLENDIVILAKNEQLSVVGLSHARLQVMIIFIID